MSKPKPDYNDVDEGQPLVDGISTPYTQPQPVMQQQQPLPTPMMVAPNQMQMMQPQNMQPQMMQPQMMQPQMMQMQQQQPMMNTAMKRSNVHQQIRDYAKLGQYEQIAQLASQRQASVPRPFQPQQVPEVVDWQTYNRGYQNDQELSIDSFEGSIDEQNRRQGQGNQTYPDGSRYEGQWVNNMRQGYGEFKQDNEVYKGNWMNDLKHGQGQLVRQNEVLTGSWVNGHLDGQVNVEKNGSQSTTTYILGSELPVKDSKLAQDGVIVEIFFCLAFYGFIATAILYDPYMAIVSVYFYICLLCASMGSKFDKILGQNLIADHDPLKLVSNLIAQPIVIEMKISNYHVVGSGEDSVDEKTHEAVQYFQYSQWTDTTSPVEYFQRLKQQSPCQVKLHLDTQFSFEASNRYCLEKYYFQKGNIIDEYYDFQEKVIIDQFDQNKDFLLLDKKNLPCYLNFYVLVFMQLIGFGWLMRLIFQCKSKKADVKIGKLIIA